MAWGPALTAASLAQNQRPPFWFSASAGQTLKLQVESGEISGAARKALIKVDKVRILGGA